MQSLREQKAARSASTAKLVQSFHSHHVSARVMMRCCACSLAQLSAASHRGSADFGSLHRCASIPQSSQSSYQFLVQKLSRDLELLLEHTRSRDAEGRETALNKERTDGCMHIMRQLGQSAVQPAVCASSLQQQHPCASCTSCPRARCAPSVADSLCCAFALLLRTVQRCRLPTRARSARWWRS